MDFADRVLAEIRVLREHGEETREQESYIGGLKRALSLYLGSDRAQEFLSSNGEAV